MNRCRSGGRASCVFEKNRRTGPLRFAQPPRGDEMGGMPEEKLTGCMLGSALADAIGELAFHSADEEALRARIASVATLRYTDDTAMAMGLAQSLIACRTLDQEHLGRTFHTNFIAEPWRGYASGPPEVFARVHSQGIRYVEAAGRLFAGRGSFGNGAAMRVAPIGLYYHDAKDLYEKAGASAEVTHTHVLAKDGAGIQAVAVARAAGLDPAAPFPLESFLRGLIDAARTPEFQEKLQLVRSLVTADVDCRQAAGALGQTVAVHESLPFAIYAFLRHPDSFERCIMCAVLSGGDRDTLGAMAGAVSGAFLGVDAIPLEWRAKLENRDILAALAAALSP